ncbi:unnamed protein product [Fraxinus pennsylvanica]|uniref:Cation-transporting P-type ATPase C-terminal domain-containing protein n=1 Tax=Fraxinus pennsylvanica TaxID=56036 RepID=A0AAD2EEJ6_9LAMI|nr:unnamed protein product [Fraxinus pennsylvanica]
MVNAACVRGGGGETSTQEGATGAVRSLSFSVASNATLRLLSIPVVHPPPLHTIVRSVAADSLTREQLLSIAINFRICSPYSCTTALGQSDYGHLGALALATEPPHEGLMKQPPVMRTEGFITRTIWRNILVASNATLRLLSFPVVHPPPLHTIVRSVAADSMTREQLLSIAINFRICSPYSCTIALGQSDYGHLGALALATEPPHEGLMKQPPVMRTEGFITKTMWRNILG